MTVRPYLFPCLLAFAAGVAFRDTGQEWLDTKKAKQTAEFVRKCAGFVVLAMDGQTKCRDLMLRFDYWWGCPEMPKFRQRITQAKGEKQ